MVRWLITKWVVWRYCQAGLAWGAMKSYCPGHMDRPYQFLADRLDRWQKRYTRLGFVPVPRIEWIMAGGYDLPYKDMLYIKDQQQNESNQE